jgi:hypothetical protein
MHVVGLEAISRTRSVSSVSSVALEEPPDNGQQVDRVDTRPANSVTDDATTRQGVAKCLAGNGSWHFTGPTISSRCINDLPELAEVEPYVRAGFTTVDDDVARAEVGVSDHRALTHRAAELALELLTIKGHGQSRSAGGPGAALFDDGRKAGARDQHTSTIPAVLNRMRLVDHCRRQDLLADGALERFRSVSDNPNAVISLCVRKMKRAAVAAEEIAAGGKELHRAAAVIAIHRG